jgi:hypothetical protein
MNLRKKLHEELMRYRSINNYGKRFITEEQEEPIDPADLPTGDEPMDDAPMKISLLKNLLVICQ